jgi:CheY-like chemotaxis protein
MPQQTVLVVDDDTDIRDAVTAALKEEGYTVRSAVGSTVLRIAQEAPPPDVILLDVMMPHIDGAKLCQLLRANPRTAHIPIVAMTALPQSNVPTELRYDAWLGKPFELTELFSIIGAVTKPHDPTPAP